MPQTDLPAAFQRLKARWIELQEAPKTRWLTADEMAEAQQMSLNLPALIEFIEAMIAEIPSEHSGECPKRHGYDHMRCRCEKDYMDEAAARLAEGLR